MAKIAVLSGKGGTGKTFVSVNLASVIGNSTYIDCDVEEPNGRLFLNPENIVAEEVFVKNPVVDHDICVGCRRCVDFCEFNALAYVGNRIMVFDNICHSCGGCSIVCPQGAISEVDKQVGRIETGKNNGITCVTGLMNVAVASGVPVINAAMENVGENTVLDCPPGSSCEVMETVEDADYCLIVVEPTRFSYHNYLMVRELLTVLNKKYGVVINKDDRESDIVFDDNILCRIDFDRQIAEELSAGGIPVNVHDGIRKKFEDLYQKICEEVAND